MQNGDPFFWMDGILATDLVEVTEDVSRVQDGGFWAVAITFEGARTFARFANVQRNQPFPETLPWSQLKSIWKSSLRREEYYSYVEEVRRHISEGTVYQSNACRVLSTPFAGPSLDALFAEILRRNMAPYATFIRLPGLEIASATPELFLRRTDREILTSPIKGSQNLNARDIFGEKDQSENIMIVDLMRNDLSRVCEIGTVRVADFLRSENHPGIRHLVSDVRGTLRAEISWDEILQGLLPPGSVTGTPKHSSLEIISRYEPIERGIYCGVVGWIEDNQALLGLAIRTFWCKSRTLYFGTGAGITWPSDPHQEWRETELKANRLIGIAGGIDEEGWQYGEGIFETLLMSENRPLLFSEHMDRAEASAKALGIEVPPRDSILRAISYLARFPLARLRLSFGTQFSLSITPYAEERTPMSVCILLHQYKAGIGRRKVFPYWENSDLLRAARFEGFDEVLLVDESGVVGEGATCNYLFKIGGSWVTPPLDAGVLPGVMRALALELGLATERAVNEAQLGAIESMIALSSLRIARPVARLGESDLLVGPECELIYDALWAAVQSNSVG